MQNLALAVLVLIWIDEASAQVTEKKLPATPPTQGQKELLKERDRLNILETTHGKDDWRAIDARWDRETVRILEKLSPPERQLLIKAEELNQEMQRLGPRNPRAALELAKEALQIRRKLLGENHPDYAASINNLANLYEVMGAYDKALPLYQQARDLWKKLLEENHPHYAASLNNLAILYRAMGAHDKALPLHQQACDLLKKLVGENHPHYAFSLNNLANLYEAMGAYDKALPLYQQSRGLLKKLLGENHPDYAGSLNSLANLYQAMGAHDKALSLYQQARDLWKKLLGENHPHYAASLNNLANQYSAMGAYDKALPLYQQARDLRKKLLGENHPDYAGSLNNLAILYQAMGAYDQALPLYRQARDLQKKLLGENHALFALSLNNLANLYQSMGADDKALPLYQQACDLRKKLLGENHPRYAGSLSNLARLYQVMGANDKVLSLLEEALRIQARHLDRTFAVQSERERLLGVKQMEAGLARYLTVAEIEKTPAVGSYEHVLSFKGQAALRGADEQAAHEQPELRNALEKLRLARASLAGIAGKPPASSADQPAWFKRYRKADEDRENLEVELAQKSQAFRRFLKLRQAGPDQVLAALPRDTALVDFLVYRHTVPVKGKWNIQERLQAFVLMPGKELVLEPLGPAEPIEKLVQEWRRGAARYPPLPVEEPGRELARLLWQPLEKHLAGVKTVLIAPDGFLCGLAFAALPGKKPGSYLLEEYAIATIPSGRHLLRLADRDGPKGTGLLAVGDLDFGKRTAPLPEDDIPALFLQRVTWQFLPGSRGELDRLVASFQKAFSPEEPQVLRGNTDAARLKSLLPPGEKSQRYRYLHLATHGFFEPPPKKGANKLDDQELLSFGEQRQQLTYLRNPLLMSGLVLGGANASPDKGTLTAEEVSSLDLRGTELVVLSACETGLGKAAGGEGVLGLQRAFQSAGARTLITSLWSVNDAATAVLMEEFYANLWTKKMPKLEALRQAQLTMLRNPNKIEQRQKELLAELRKRGVSDELLASRGILSKAGTATAPVSATESPRSHPRYWAAFVLSGDWR